MGFLLETECSLIRVYPFKQLYRRKKNTFCDDANCRALPVTHGRACGNPGPDSVSLDSTDIHCVPIVCRALCSHVFLLQSNVYFYLS